MAQYYNFVTNASGTFTLEDVQRICCVNGQSIQFLVEDKSNGGNGSQQVLTYTAAPQNTERAILSQQTVNLGSQIPTTQLEQGQNVLIIKTNDISEQQNILKTTTVAAQTVGENIVNTVDNKGSKALINYNGQQIQWIKMQENSLSFNTVSKQNTLASEKVQAANINRNQQQNNISLPGNCESQVPGGGITKRRPLRAQQNRNRSLPNNIQSGNLSGTSDGAGITGGVNSNVSDVKSPATPFRSKGVGSYVQNVTQTVAQERKQKQMQTPRQMQNDQRSSLSNVQRQVSNMSQPTMQTPMNSPPQRQQSSTNTVRQQQQQQQQTAPTSPMQKQESTVSQTPPSRNMHNVLEVESPEHGIHEKVNQSSRQSSPSQTDSESNASESFAYVQKIIDNPSNTVVQRQIIGNTAKMLVILTNGEQRLITFDIPKEDCTVQDLLEQANILFSGETTVSLVSDTALGINYIVEARAGSITAQHTTEPNEAHSPQENTNTNHDSTNNAVSSPDENSNPMQQHEEPLYFEGMLAVCSHCGISSIDFNRCLRCKRKLPKDVKTVPMRMGIQEKKENMLSVDTFYKKNNGRNSLSKRGGRGRGKGVTRTRPIRKEPECLTISSDEEEDGKNKIGDCANNSTFSSNASNSCSDETETIFEKEPVITNHSVSTTSTAYTTDNDDTSKDNSVQVPHTTLCCRTVRIGSYKYVPREKIVFSQNGIRFGVPLLEDDTNFVTLDIKYQDIVKVLVHFGKATPVLFIYTTTNTGTMIRELLGMQDPKGPYYDPVGKDYTHKRITLLPDKLNDDSKSVIKSLLTAKDKFEELNAKEANDVLVKASPKDYILKRQSSSLSNSANGGIQTITVYPPPPAKGGIAINTEDYLCLGEDQFLNDVIIDFYLKYLTLEVLSEADQQRTHVFSSYFYKRLTSPHAQASESTVTLSSAAKRHARVRKWTKNVNIFQKDFIIIPINEHAHWFLAIICFPGLVGKVPTSPPVTENDIHKTVQKSKKLKEVKLQAVTIGNTTITPVSTTITIDQVDDSSERDEAEGDDEEMEMDSDDDEQTNETEEAKQKAMEQNSLQEKDTVKVPCILIFDSLAGASRSRVVATLRDYLSCEHVAKMKSEKVFSKDTIKGASPKVPQQSNFTDCGLYVLQYVESFFKNPIKDYTLPIKTLKNWFEEIVVTRKREELSKLLIKLMNATKGDKNISLPVANFPTHDGKLKVKPENNVEMKSPKPEVENKKKPTAQSEIRTSNNVSTASENSEQSNEPMNATIYPIIPYSPTSPNSSESNSTEMLTEPSPPNSRSNNKTISFLKAIRIPRLMLRTENQDDSQAAKRHKGESFNSCK